MSIESEADVYPRFLILIRPPRLAVCRIPPSKQTTTDEAGRRRAGSSDSCETITTPSCDSIRVDHITIWLSSPGGGGAGGAGGGGGGGGARPARPRGRGTRRH